MLEVISVQMPVLSATEVLVQKLLALDEHYCDFGPMIAVVRALREQVDFDRVRKETSQSAFAAAVLFLLEMFADKIPYLDSMWDSVHTVVRPAVGATLGYLLAGHEGSGLEQAFAAATGGFSALASHGVKAGIRAGVNASPEPVSNVAISSAEDVAVIGVMTLATEHPWAAATVAGILLLAGIVAVVWLLRRIVRLKRRYDDWGTRTG